MIEVGVLASRMRHCLPTASPQRHSTLNSEHMLTDCHNANKVIDVDKLRKQFVLYDRNEKMIQLTGHELQATQRFNRFVVEVYIQAWFSCRATVDAPSNDIQLINRLQDYGDEAISKLA